MSAKNTILGELIFFNLLSFSSWTPINKLLSLNARLIAAFTFFGATFPKSMNLPTIRCAICVKQSFFSSDLFRCWSWRYPEVRGSGWWNHTCVKNLPQVGVEIFAKFGGDWSDGSLVKEVHRYK